MECMLLRVPTNNRDPKFNCQTWVESAPKASQNQVRLSKASYHQGLEGISNAIPRVEDIEVVYGCCHRAIA